MKWFVGMSVLTLMLCGGCSPMENVEVEQDEFTAALAHAVDSGDTSAVTVTLKRTQCYGTCPAYVLVLKGDGSVEYTGEEFVAVTGKRTGTIAKAAFKALLDEAIAIDFNSLKDVYATSITDMPTTYTTIRVKDLEKKIENYYGAPIDLITFESKIDRAANAEKWTKGQKLD